MPAGQYDRTQGRKTNPLTTAQWTEATKLRESGYSLAKVMKYYNKLGYTTITGLPLRMNNVTAFFKSKGHTMDASKAYRRGNKWSVDTNFHAGKSLEISGTKYRKTEDGLYQPTENTFWADKTVSTQDPLFEIREILRTNISATTKLTAITAVVSV